MRLRLKVIIHLIVNKKSNSDDFSLMNNKGIVFDEKAEVGKTILVACKMMTPPDAVPLGEYQVFLCLFL